jgi:uncharacterized membrane protein
MFRALNAFLGFILTLVGLTVTFATWSTNGWAVVAGVGVAMLAVEFWIEERSSQPNGGQ